MHESDEILQIKLNYILHVAVKVLHFLSLILLSIFQKIEKKVQVLVIFLIPEKYIIFS